jgi:hypothetical protein
MSGCCAWHILWLLWIIVASIYKIPSQIRKLLTGHDIYPQTVIVDLEWARHSVTLTLEVEVWLLRMTHCLIIINICVKLFQIPLINDKESVTDGQTDRRTDRAFFYILLYSSKRLGIITIITPHFFRNVNFP